MKLKDRLKPYFSKHPRLIRSARFVLMSTKSFSDHSINMMAAQLSYFIIVAFFTLSVTIVYATSLIPIIKEGAAEASATLFPSAINRLFNSIVSQVSMPNKFWPLITTAVASFWFSSRAVRSMMFSFDTIYHAKQAKKNYQRTFRSMLFTLVFEVLLATVMVFSVSGKSIALQILSPLKMSTEFIAFWNWLRLVFPVILMLMAFWFFYFYLTNVKIRFIHAFPGALFTTRALADYHQFLFAVFHPHHPVSFTARFGWVNFHIPCLDILVLKHHTGWCGTKLSILSLANGYAEKQFASPLIKNRYQVK